jgi:hypothetical protein
LWERFQTFQAHLYVESWKAVYFEPLIVDLKAIAVDEISKDALKAGPHKAIIWNTKGIITRSLARFEEREPTLDHDPSANAGDIGPRGEASRGVGERSLGSGGFRLMVFA